MRKLALLTVLLALPLAAFAGENVTVSGVLVDKMCSGETKTTEKALEHSKDCALMDQCAASGFGVVTAEGAFLTFDAAGNKKAVEFLKSFKGDQNIKITVQGTKEGSALKVTSIKQG